MSLVRGLVVLGAVGGLNPGVALHETVIAETQALAGGAGPALVYLNAATQEGCREPVVQRALSGFARVGFRIVAPELPGLRTGTITPDAFEATVAVIAAVAAHAPVRVLGVSTGASLGILAAADERLNSRIARVTAVTPFAHLDRIVCLATTGIYPGRRGSYPHTVAPLLVRAVERSLVAAAGGDRQVVAPVLENRDVARFAKLWAALPSSIQAVVAALSPAQAAARVRVPVELVSSACDRYFPLEESETLARTCPQARLTVLAALDHGRPRLSGLPQLLRLTGFAARLAA